MEKQCMLEAHQGVATEAPGNTLAAFRLACLQGYDMAELDTKFTRDGHCVILHNNTVNATARWMDGSPLADETPIRSLTLAEARRLDFGIAFGEKYCGEQIPTLEEVLSFALSNRFPLKLDNVMWSHTPREREILFDAVAQLHALPYVGFTANNLCDIRQALQRFPEAAIHYDGPSDEETLRTLSGMMAWEKLTVWVRYGNQRTSWNTTPPATEEYCAMVRRYARLGVWILDRQEEYERARDIFQADIAETDGSVKPQ